MKKTLTILGAIMFVLGLTQYLSALFGMNTVSLGNDGCDTSVGWMGISVCSNFMAGWLHWILMVVGAGMFGAAKKM